jgi:CheY-like chemotaxis protein
VLQLNLNRKLRDTVYPGGRSVAKILVADDNSNIQKMVGLALKDQGIDVVAVGNGEAAVRKISDIRPDLVLADVFMPVRNGYEVCRYVKEDSSLAHIPVILLVGAFDPLDEQEAQRVGADGVLKKPFVPPDPLISMVKSALVRAGVPLGPAAPAEKASPTPKYPAADILGAGVTSKLAALSPEKLPEATPEPVEEFAIPAPNLKIAAGSGPVAFSSLLDTSDAEDMAVTAKPMIDLANDNKWHEESDDIEEEKEEAEEPLRGGWRPGGLDEAAEHKGPSNTAPDWRDEAFHGNSPAKSFSSSHWAPSVEQSEHVEAAESPSVAVATMSNKQAENALPFTGDAWAAAMAAGIEEKTTEATNAPLGNPEVERSQAPREQLVEEASPTVHHTNPMETAGPANWAMVPETAWEIEAKKASLLASTWDSPKSFSVEETQDIAAFAKEALLETGGAQEEAHGEASPYAPEPIISAESLPEAAMSEPAISSSHEFAEKKPWEHDVVEPPVAHSEPPVIPAPEHAAPDVNEIVARVLGKIDPEMLQKVTREILRPMIEAIVRDEISKSS